MREVIAGSSLAGCRLQHTIKAGRINQMIFFMDLSFDGRIKLPQVWMKVNSLFTKKFSPGAAGGFAGLDVPTTPGQSGFFLFKCKGNFSVFHLFRLP